MRKLCASLVRRFAEGTPRALVVILLCNLISACSSQENAVAKSPNGKLFAVASEQTSFYRYGPQQGNGPDASLPKDTLMTLIRPSFGYCKVQVLPDKKEGYVASEDIQPAPRTLLASLNAPVHTASTSRGGSERENFDIGSSEPPPPEALPDPDLPPTQAEPSPQ